MCGIAGILDLAGTTKTSLDEIASMIGMLHHRGPDGYGFYISGPLGLAHARLSIIDLAGGTQPIHNEDSTVWVIFNGEIFNYLELRRDLKSRGHRFYTESDTEVLVHLYEEYAEHFVDHLNGQFAIALWDKRQRKLLLVRDRVGIHPLFFSKIGSRLAFSSEIKAICALPTFTPEINPNALAQVFTYWAPYGDTTIMMGVSQVRPGEMLVVQSGRLVRRPYWDWRFPVDQSYDTAPLHDQAAALHELLLDATRIRLRADVPVGAYLSGGLDSSVIAALIRKTRGDLATFSIGFEDAHLDESSYQESIHRHLCSEHRRLTCRASDVGDAFEHAIWHTEVPVLRTAPVPMMLLSKMVRRENYKVVLTGEGADEVLGGYDIFKELKLRLFLARQPESKFRPLLLKRLYPYFQFAPGRAPEYLTAFFGADRDQANNVLYSHLPRWRTTAKCKEFFAGEFLRSIRSGMEIQSELPAEIRQWSSFNRAQFLEAKTLMPNYILASQGDRMLMANSIEGRFPFLDHRVIEYVNRIDPRVKMKVLNEKYLLKRAMAAELPDQVVRRHKQPYRAPDIPAFAQGRGAHLVDELLSPAAISRYGYFDPVRTTHLVRKARSGRAIGYKDNMAFVGILSTQIWHRLFVENRNNFVTPVQHVLRGAMIVREGVDNVG